MPIKFPKFSPRHLPYVLMLLVLIAAGVFVKEMVIFSGREDDHLAAKQALSDAQSQMQKPEEQNNYTHPDPNFSFQYPKSMNAASFEEGEGETILVQSVSSPLFSKEGAGGVLGMQIYISDFDEDITLTAQRIKQDMPGIKMDNAKSISVGNITGAAFLGQDESLGQTYEVWLVYNKHLYQILSYASQKDLVDKILSTWSWQ